MYQLYQENVTRDDRCSNTRKKKVAIIHPQFFRRGGAEARAVWVAESLKEEYDVSLVTMGAVDIALLNDWYGTALAARSLRLISLPIPALFKKRGDALRAYRLCRWCKRHAGDFDVMISTYNVMDFGTKGLQFIADVSFDDALRRRFHPHTGNGRFLYRRSVLRDLYLKMGRSLAGITQDGWRQNSTIANSSWSRAVMQEQLGVTVDDVVYPPVYVPARPENWDKREFGFVWIGRIVPEKEVEKAIEIIRQVRMMGYDAHLHIIGDAPDTSYAGEISALCREYRQWVSWNSFYGEKKWECVFKHKFGIATCAYEAFGIAVAELVKAGCVVWVPRSGGQVEIVDHPLLTYTSVEDAVRNIGTLLESRSLQDSVRIHLECQGAKFSTDNFMSAVRRKVRVFLDTAAKPAGCLPAPRSLRVKSRVFFKRVLSRLDRAARLDYKKRVSGSACVVRFQEFEGRFYVRSRADFLNVSRCFGSAGRHEEQMLKPLLARLQPGHVGYDIGASVGMYSIFMAKRVEGKGRVVAFEPAGESYRILQKNIVLNNTHNIIALPCALGAGRTRKTLYAHRHISIGAHSVIPQKNARAIQELTIVAADEIIEQKKLPLPHAVKIDVEGYEYEVLQGMRTTLRCPQCTMLCCEVHPRVLSEDTVPAIVALLRNCGFSDISMHPREGEVHLIAVKPPCVDRRYGYAG